MAKVHDNATDLITFSRSSSGTALRRVGYGDELVDNGDFATTDISAWDSFDGTLAVVGGQLELTYTNATQYVWVEVTTTPGTLYEFSIDCRSDNAVGHKLVAWSEAFPLGTQIAINPSFVNFSASLTTQTLGVRATTSTTLFMVATQLTSGTAYFDNISVKEVIFDRATDPLVLFNHPDDTPRIEYGSDGALKGLLIEEQRTNYSVDAKVTTSSWAGIRASIDRSGSATFLDGSVATLLKEDTTVANTHHTQEINYTDSNSATIVFSVFVKKPDTNSRPYVQLRISDDAAGANKLYSVLFDMSDGSFLDEGSINNPTNTFYGSKQCADGWFRIWCGLTKGGTSTRTDTQICLSDSATITSLGNIDVYTGDGVSGLYVAGAQLEQGSFATSYIPTSGSQETRWADVASIPVSAFGYNDQAGTWVVNWTNGPDVTDDQQYLLFITGPAGNLVYSNAGATSSYAYDGSNVLGHGGWVADQEQTLAVAMSPTEAVSSLDGAAVNSSAHNGNLTADRGRTLYLGDRATGPRPLNGHIKSLKYYPRRLTDAQLQELTA